VPPFLSPLRPEVPQGGRPSRWHFFPPPRLDPPPPALVCDSGHFVETPPDPASFFAPAHFSNQVFGLSRLPSLSGVPSSPLVKLFPPPGNALTPTACQCFSHDGAFDPGRRVNTPPELNHGRFFLAPPVYLGRPKFSAVHPHRILRFFVTPFGFFFLGPFWSVPFSEIGALPCVQTGIISMPSRGHCKGHRSTGNFTLDFVNQGQLSARGIWFSTSSAPGARSPLPPLRFAENVVLFFFFCVVTLVEMSNSWPSSFPPRNAIPDSRQFEGPTLGFFYLWKGSSLVLMCRGKAQSPCYLVPPCLSLVAEDKCPSGPGLAGAFV